MTSTTAAGAQQPPTLFAWAGGAEALSRLTRIFYGHVKTDPILAPVFAEMSPHHPEWVAQWLGEVFGGPATYTNERGGYPHMLARHLGRALNEQQRARPPPLAAQAPGSEQSAAMTGAPSFVRDIRPLFTDRDRASMSWAFDLGDVAAVCEHADAILDQVAAGRMPCYGAWPAEQVAVFRRWVESGKLD
jgi:hypothetical protein